MQVEGEAGRVAVMGWGVETGTGTGTGTLAERNRGVGRAVAAATAAAVARLLPGGEAKAVAEEWGVEEMEPKKPSGRERGGGGGGGGGSMRCRLGRSRGGRVLPRPHTF